MIIAQRIASYCYAQIAGTSAGRRPDLPAIAAGVEQLLRDDPELAAHFRRQAHSLPALRAARQREDAD